MRIAAVVNPVAGSRKAPKQWPVLLQSIGREAKRIDTFWSEYPGHSESIAASARRSGYDRVIAVGGDGTLFEVLNGLWCEEQGHMPSLGMIPFGTGCDYIRNFENGTGMAARLKTAVEESAIGVSLGRCRYQVQDGIRQRVFAMVLGLGFDAEVIYRYKKLSLPRSSWFSYAISALAAIRELRPFTLDGFVEDSPFRVDAVFFGAALGCCFGNGIRIAPCASPSHNRFEFVLAAPVSPVGLLFQILRAYLRLNKDSPLLTRLSGSRAKIRSSMPIRFEADGELLGQSTVIDIELIPEAFYFAAGKIKNPS
jgi:YegS/Rv2252/BmrU family lipid kinase